MLEARHGLRFSKQPRFAFLGRERAAAQQLHRDLAIELRVVRCEHLAHAARAELLEQHVSTERRATLEP